MNEMNLAVYKQFEQLLKKKLTLKKSNKLRYFGMFITAVCLLLVAIAQIA